MFLGIQHVQLLIDVINVRVLDFTARLLSLSLHLSLPEPKMSGYCRTTRRLREWICDQL